MVQAKFPSRLLSRRLADCSQGLKTLLHWPRYTPRCFCFDVRVKSTRLHSFLDLPGAILICDASMRSINHERKSLGLERLLVFFCASRMNQVSIPTGTVAAFEGFGLPLCSVTQAPPPLGCFSTDDQVHLASHFRDYVVGSQKLL